MSKHVQNNCIQVKSAAKQHFCVQTLAETTFHVSNHLPKRHFCVKLTTLRLDDSFVSYYWVSRFSCRMDIFVTNGHFCFEWTFLRQIVNFLSFYQRVLTLCTASVWRRSSTFFWKASSHRSHANGFTPACLRMCVIRLELCENALLHTRHLCGFSPEKTLSVEICGKKDEFRGKQV